MALKTDRKKDVAFFQRSKTCVGRMIFGFWERDKLLEKCAVVKVTTKNYHDHVWNLTTFLLNIAEKHCVNENCSLCSKEFSMIMCGTSFYFSNWRKALFSSKIAFHPLQNFPHSRASQAQEHTGRF